MNTPDTKAAPTGHAGSPRIAAVFAEKARQGRAALIPYVTAGFPEPEQALAVLRALVRTSSSWVYRSPTRRPMAPPSSGPMTGRWPPA